jgi:hypothetical protein
LKVFSLNDFATNSIYSYVFQLFSILGVAFYFPFAYFYFLKYYASKVKPR